jgi:hypothetical protein
MDLTRETFRPPCSPWAAAFCGAIRPQAYFVNALRTRLWYWLYVK